jgi:hypothetical protein
MAQLLFALYTILSIITWLFREYVPESRKDWVHVALHYGGVIIYLVLVAYVVHQLQQPWWVLLVEATLIRALLFDPSLNLSQSWFNYREGRPAEHLFKVGTIAAGDRAIRWAADKLSMEPEHLRCLLWLVCLALAIAAFIFGSHVTVGA